MRTTVLTMITIMILSTLTLAQPYRHYHHERSGPLYIYDGSRVITGWQEGQVIILHKPPEPYKVFEDYMKNNPSPTPSDINKFPALETGMFPNK